MRFLTSLALAFLAATASYAQQDTAAITVPATQTPKRFYTGSGLDFAMLSTAIVARPGQDAKLTAPRLTALLNVGFKLHYDASRRFGIFSGLGLKNIGFIEKFNDGDSTIKRRVYSLGIPLGLKIGDLRNRNFFFLGGGVDFPVHYKEKRFTKRSDKRKLDDWFSDQTPRVLPYAFAGYSFDPGVMLKLQYYPTNFLNTDYTNSAGVKPFTGYNVNLLVLSLGFDLHYGQYRKQEKEYQKMRKEKEQVNLM
jgi:hypothetical protein